MSKISAVNDFVVRFANVNGTGSASANNMFAKAVFRMGIPISPKNIFPSNIQGLPTWFEIRINEKGYLGRRAGIDLIVSVNPQSMIKDIADVKPGGYFVYDNTRKLHKEFLREDINFIGIPMMQLCMDNYVDPKKQQLFKNIVYVGALAALLDLDINIVKVIIAEQFEKKPKLIPPNYQALQLGLDYVRANFECPLGIRLEPRKNVGDHILIEGNTATALGAIYAGATVAAWYPITPSTSVVSAFEKYANKLRIDKETGQKKFAIIQAEDELAAMGMVIGATWNGARAFTSTSGPGVSLMSEFIGLAYFAEIPVVLINVQRGGPSTGMPTRTQQPDILSSAYASHGDTKHVLLFPSTPTECFDLTVAAFDLADRLQTPVILMSDLDLGMNNHMSEPLKWDDAKKYDLGKVLNAEDLENMEVYGRYLDVDGDGVCYRTIPGTHPTKGSFFTRGTSRDEYAQYTEDGSVYVKIVDRLLKKWETAKEYVPKPMIRQQDPPSKYGIIFFGTTRYAALEAMELLEAEGIALDAMRILAFPFNQAVDDFIEKREKIFVIEQNRDAQFRSLLINELEVNPKKLIKILNYDGMPITADTIKSQIIEKYPQTGQKVQTQTAS
ncbi:MAG: 2-oxoglutarate ferredoxin oxidoreductase subunit alpha [Saprospiraceae bacterium]|jgi:2-oxoglutarate ferredoxin oxidoreductase subunit alpha